ncbi:MAG: OadG family protein [Ruminococcus sp.]|nr:OadG family protein [Ruminococcus sp.]
MNLSGITSLMNVADLTMAEKGITSAKVVLTGFVVVFAVLVLLIVIISIYSSIIQAAQNSGKKKQEKVVENIKATTTDKVEAPVETVAPVAQDGISEEVIAVISAAVATMYGSPEKAKIKSIKKSDGGRSAWANAGLLNNTRPF